MSLRTATVFVCLAVTMAHSAHAVALRPNKATDDSVCDLTHHTNLYLGSKVLVPAVASTKDQTDAFFRLAGEFVGSKCRNGQMLMVQGSSSSSVDVRSLTELANSSCAVASVNRTEIQLSFANVTEPGFELRCMILKHDELVSKLNELEKVDPMDVLKARMYTAVQRAEGTAPGPNAAAKKDCGKVTLATLFGGGSCK